MNHMRLEILDQLRSRDHWDLRHRVLNYEHARAPHRQWDIVLKTENPEHVVVFNGTPVMAQWACARGLPAIFVGGHADPYPVPTVGFRPRPMIEESVRELIRWGHRDICLPMFALFPLMAEKVRETVGRCLQEAGMAFDAALHTPTAPQRSAEIIQNTMETVIARRPPTGIIAMHAEDFISIHCALARKRLRVPEEVSAIVLQCGTLAEWFRPTLTHFAVAARSITRIVQRWIDQHHPLEFRPIGVGGNLVRGESVGPPPAAASRR
jgi:DNA-binding LacI/PurR family transcriptional regulator